MVQNFFHLKGSVYQCTVYPIPLLSALTQEVVIQAKQKFLNAKKKI